MLIRVKGWLEGEGDKMGNGEMSNPVSWVEEKLLSTPKQGTIYKLRLLFERGRGTKCGN
jgi:hypothetical protein